MKQDRDRIDVIVGKNIKLTRTARGITQSELAAAAGVTFQQFQKYEKGSNRISASRLYKTCKALDVELDSLFDGVDAPTKKNYEDSNIRNNDSIMEIVSLLRKVDNDDLRKSILSLVRSVIQGK